MAGCGCFWVWALGLREVSMLPPACPWGRGGGVGGLRLMAPFTEHLFCAKPGAGSFTSSLSSLHSRPVKTARQ